MIRQDEMIPAFVWANHVHPNDSVHTTYTNACDLERPVFLRRLSSMFIQSTALIDNDDEDSAEDHDG